LANRVAAIARHQRGLAARSGDDQSVELALVAPGLYEGRLARPLYGRWHLQLEDAGRLWRVAAMAQMPAASEIGLEPTAQNPRVPEVPRWSGPSN
jgi:hypothetical protein